jgi:glycosyltransferase involved in cell wall biosynthesis
MPHPLVYVAPDAEVVCETALDRLDRLRSEGFDIWVAAPESPGLDTLAYEGFRTRPLPGRAKWNVAGWLGAYFILQGLFLEIRPSLVHGFGLPWAWIAAFAANRAETTGIAATVESHDFATAHPMLQALLSRLPDAVRERTPDAASAYRWLSRRADVYFVYHEEDMRELSDRRVVPGGKLELVVGGTGVDLGRFDIHDEELVGVKEARRIVELPPETRTVLGFAGPWSATTRTAVTDAARALARTHPGVQWLVANAPEASLDHLPVTVVGTDDETFYRALDLYAGFDPNDAVGQALMNAAAMRVPAVAIDSPAARSVIVDFETGRIAAPVDFLDTTAAVLSDSKRLADMGIRARARAEQRFDRRQIDEQILRAYDRVLTQASRRR